MNDAGINLLIKKLILFISISIILVLIYLSLFNNFQSDDFWFAQSNFKGWYSQSKWIYNNWGGRFFSYSVNAAVPIQSFVFPKAYPILLFILSIFSLVLNFRVYFYYGLKKALEKAIVLFFIYISLLLSISEHFFWYSAINVYWLPMIMCSFFLYFYRKYSLGKDLLYLVVLYVLGILIMGSNEVLAIIFLASLSIDYYLTGKSWKLYLLIILLFFISLSFFSPGNFIRISTEQNSFDLKKFVLLRGYAFVVNIVWLFLKSVCIIPLILFYFEEELKQLRKTTHPKRLFFLFIPALFAFIFLGLLSQISARANDSILTYCAFVFAFIISYYMWPKTSFVLVCLVILFLPKVYLFPKRDNLFMINYNNFKILKEILVTDLIGFNNEVITRKKMMDSVMKPKIYVKPLINKPVVLYFEEMGTEKKPNYINSHLNGYYNKNIFLENGNERKN